MASQNINVGTNADDGTGESLRSAFIDIRKMFAELYGQTYTSDTQDLGGTTLALKAEQLSLTNTAEAATDNYVITYDDASGGFTLEEKFDGDITGIVAGNGLTGDATSGDASLAVGAGTGITVNADDIQIADGGVDTLQLADDGVSYDKMGAEFTTAAVISASDVDFSSAQVFTKTLSGNTTLTFSSVSTGMVKDLVITGAYTLALPASVKTITGTYDGSVGNLIQIVSTNGATEQWASISQEA
jgi:hypothetical protein